MKLIRRKKDEKIYKDSWLYILLLTTLVILIESLRDYTFTIGGVQLSYSLLPLPLVYFLVNYIVKRFDYKQAVAAISISGVIFVCFSAIVSFALGERLILSSVSGEFCGYVISQFVNLTIYYYIINNTRAPYVLVLLNYMFALIVYYLFYTIIYLDLVIYEDYWTTYFITLTLQFVVCAIVAFIDCKIRRGHER